MHELGFTLYGTAGTVTFMDEHDVLMNLVHKVTEGSPNIIDMIRGSAADMIINTPKGKASRVEHLCIMNAAIDYSIPYVSTAFGAQATVKAIETMKSEQITIGPRCHNLGK